MNNSKHNGIPLKNKILRKAYIISLDHSPITMGLAESFHIVLFHNKSLISIKY